MNGGPTVTWEWHHTQSLPICGFAQPSYWSCGNSSHAAAAFVLALPKVWGWLLRLSTCATLPTRGGYNKRLWLWIIIKQARQSLNLWINSFYDFRVSPHCINKCLATYSPITRRDHWQWRSLEWFHEWPRSPRKWIGMDVPSAVRNILISPIHLGWQLVLGMGFFWSGLMIAVVACVDLRERLFITISRGD